MQSAVGKRRAIALQWRVADASARKGRSSFAGAEEVCVVKLKSMGWVVGGW
jgi:hypothetical protein